MSAISTLTERTVTVDGLALPYSRVRKDATRYAPDRRGEFVPVPTETRHGSRTANRLDMTRAVRVVTRTFTLTSLYGTDRYVIVQTLEGQPNDVRTYLGELLASRAENWEGMGESFGVVETLATI